MSKDENGFVDEYLMTLEFEDSLAGETQVVREGDER